MRGFWPSLPSTQALYVAIGILGATVMPHNLYLHSALVQTRQVKRTSEGKRQANRYNLIDSAVALNCALFVNAAILILSAATFHRNGQVVTEIQQAHQLLTPLLGTSLASLAFAMALLCAGQSSTLTGTLAGQVVMEGFLRFRMRPWLRRLLTRSLAIIPAVATIAVFGDQGTYKLLILSQVILSLQLPFAVIPLVQFTSDRSKMGPFTSPRIVVGLAWASAAIIVGLNARLVADTVSGWIETSSSPLLLWFLAPAIGAVALLLLYVIVHPVLRRVSRRGAMAEVVGLPAAVADRAYHRIGIALATDASDSPTLSHGLSLAKAYGAQVVLIHVAEGFGSRFFGGESDDEETREDREYLNRARAEADRLGVPAEVRLLHGSPIDQIPKLVEEEGLDLLVMGAHGHTGLGDVLHGSTVDPVRHRVKIPVFVVRVDRTSPA